MARTIYKFGLVVALRQTITMPAGATILSLQAQRGAPQLWALVDPLQREFRERVLVTYGTGHPMPDNPGTYLGTYQIYGGAEVYHVFEV